MTFNSRFITVSLITQYRGRDSLGIDFCPSVHLLSPGDGTKNQKRPKMKKTWMKPLSWGCCGWTGRTPKGVTGMIVLGFLFCFFLVIVKMMDDDDICVRKIEAAQWSPYEATLWAVSRQSGWLTLQWWHTVGDPPVATHHTKWVTHHSISSTLHWHICPFLQALFHRNKSAYIFLKNIFPGIKSKMQKFSFRMWDLFISLAGQWRPLKIWLKFPFSFQLLNHIIF